MLLTRTTTLDAGTVAWDVAGPDDGSPVVLVHGFPARAHLWRDVVPALVRAGHRVYAYDLLGMGASEQRDGQELSFDGQARVHARIPYADLCLVPGGGHFLAEDAPGALYRLLVEFCPGVFASHRTGSVPHLRGRAGHVVAGHGAPGRRCGMVVWPPPPTTLPEAP